MVWCEMAKNRKYQSAAIRFGPALKAFLLCLAIGGSGIGYVWQKNQIYELGQQIRKREQRLQALERQNDTLRRQLATLRMPRSIEQRIKQLNLGLVAPAAGQVWQLAEPSREAPAPCPDRQLAAHASNTP
jgi:hypothetical protein